MSELLTDIAAKANNGALEYHELANEYPAIEGAEFDNLVEDIGRKGILEPITLHEGKILDGRNRYSAAKAAGHNFTERDFKELPASLDPEEFVSSKNAHRRNLNGKQKRALIAKKISRHPTFSDRAIAKLACCDHKTVGDVRKEMQRRVESIAASFHELTQMEQHQFLAAVCLCSKLVGKFPGPKLVSAEKRLERA
jgi:hypothetical protein